MYMIMWNSATIGVVLKPVHHEEFQCASILHKHVSLHLQLYLLKDWCQEKGWIVAGWWSQVVFIVQHVASDITPPTFASYMQFSFDWKVWNWRSGVEFEFANGLDSAVVGPRRPHITFVVSLLAVSNTYIIYVFSVCIRLRGDDSRLTNIFSTDALQLQICVCGVFYMYQLYPAASGPYQPWISAYRRVYNIVWYIFRDCMEYVFLYRRYNIHYIIYNVI